MEFGEKLKKYRIENGLSQDEIAKKLGTTKQVISRYETGQRTPKISVVTEYSKLLNLPPSYFFSDEKSGNEKIEEDNIEGLLKFALFNGSEGVTDEMYDEVKKFAEFVKIREQQKNIGNK